MAAKKPTFRSAAPVPTVVEVAFWLLVSGGLITAVLLVNRVIHLDWSLGGGSAAYLAETFIGGAVGLLIRLGVAITLRRGYAPARIYLTVVGVISIALGVLNRADPTLPLVVA